MRVRHVTLAALGVLALGWMSASAQPGASPTPTVGTGIAPVMGTVDIGNTPDVNAFQRGEWNVTLALPTFVVKNNRSVVTWSAGERETVSVAAGAGGGGVRVANTDRRVRWINISMARAIEDAQ